MSRLRKNFVTGTITSTLTSSGTTINLTPALGNFTVTAPDYLPLIINPNSYGGVTGTSEIVYVTAYTANSLSATISRGKESTTASGWSSGTVYSHGVLAADLPTDLPAPTASGQLLVSTSTTSGTWTTSLPSGLAIASPTISGGTISGTTITSGNTFNAGSVPTSALTGSLNATTVTGTLSTSATVSVTSNYQPPSITVPSSASFTTAGMAYITLSGYNNYLVTATFTLALTSGAASTAAARLAQYDSTGTTLVNSQPSFGFSQEASWTNLFSLQTTFTSSGSPSNVYRFYLQARNDRTGGTLNSVDLNVIGLN